MVMHSHRAGLRMPSESEKKHQKVKKGGKQSTPKQEQDKLPATPGLQAPGPKVPGLLSPGNTGTISNAGTPTETTRQSTTGTQEAALPTTPDPKWQTLSLDSLVISSAKSAAGPTGLPGLGAYTLAKARSLKASPVSFGAPQKLLNAAAGHVTSVPIPAVATPDSSVATPDFSALGDDDDNGSDTDDRKLANRLLNLLDENDILVLAHELQQQGYLQEFDLDVPRPQSQQLPSMMLPQVPLAVVAQQTFVQNRLPQSPQPHTEKQVIDLQQMLGNSLGEPEQDQQQMFTQQHVQPMYPQSPPPQDLQPDFESWQTLPANVGLQQNHKSTPPGLQSPQPRLESVLEEPAPSLTCPSPRLDEEDEEAECIQEADASLPEEEAAAAKNSSDPDKAKVSSLLIQNLPRSFTQQATRDWLDSHGYRDLYDMLMWFPAKQSAKNSDSRALINFRSPDQAKRFRREFHHFTMTTNGGTAKLAISTAKEQGFTANFIRLWHLSNQDSPNGICPFFARDMVAMMSPEDKKLAEANAQPPSEAKPVARTANPSWTSTTLAIRNLPEDVDTQDVAMSWLFQKGYENFNFLLYVPRKQNYKARTSTSPLPGGLAYLFVNFCTAKDAHACSRALHNLRVGERAPTLSVVAAKVQGYQACRDHFKELAKSGRLVPWFEPEENSKGSQKADDKEDAAPPSDAKSDGPPGSWQLYQ